MTMDEAKKELQRQKQQAALKRQSAGGLTKRELKRRRAAGEAIPKQPKISKKREWKAEEEKTVERSRPQHDLVIIPIFWRNVTGQEEAMVNEALRIKGVLHKVGLDVWVDRTHKLTPGQKLNFWESQGVRWRVEIGPKEAIKHKCVVSHQKGDAGDYSTVTKLANVSTVRQGELLSKLRNGLSLLKIPDESILTASKDKVGDDEQMAKSKKNLEAMQRRPDIEPTFNPVQTHQSAEDQLVESLKNATPTAQVSEKDEHQLNAKERRALRRAKQNQGE
mmetsp:Transcript_50916/g.65202  ORF Transcript_50916/g.65202 Transcript_50916/m.65202 type:complete len:277 (-) Transcript_50916:20-850(-)